MRVNLKLMVVFVIITFSLCCTTTRVIETSVKQEGNKEIVTTRSAIGAEEIFKLKEEWEYELLVETGEAPVLNKYAEIERNKMLAKKGAILDAQRKLAEKIGYIKITSNTTMQDYSTIDIVQSKINVYLKNVEVISEIYDENKKLYTVSIQMPKAKLINVLEESLLIK